MLSWVSQVNSQTAPADTNWLQQWIAPRWSVSNTYVNYICQTQGSGSQASEFIRDTSTNLGNQMSSGLYSKINS